MQKNMKTKKTKKRGRKEGNTPETERRMEPARSRTSAIPSGLRRRSGPSTPLRPGPEVRHAPTSRTSSATTADSHRISPPYTPSSRGRRTHTRGARTRTRETSAAEINGVYARAVTRKPKRSETIDRLLLSFLPGYGPHASLRSHLRAGSAPRPPPDPPR
uniref:B1 n=1 Tax=Human betaherpesvirus 6 TaxID=10368 RepID=A0A5P9S5A6_9BETA|nr:B1 [Human betaherpesvirus 6]QFV24096.1 B1 [Human betaherpesvirus 6]